jgi:osmotically-inducible protein OsmY
MKQKATLNNPRNAADVKSAIECLTTIPTESLSVCVQDGWVYLSGELTDRHQKEFVGEVVQHLAGVNGVTNLIEVDPHSTSRN